MPCYHPLKGYRDAYGGWTADKTKGGAPMEVSCGQCIGCRLARSEEWAVRITHEAQMHEANSFITLTYNDENLPKDHSLDHNEFRQFIKRLRRKYPGTRYYMAGEYGDTFSRPHYHAILFGLWFNDATLFKRTDSGRDLYLSEDLSKMWQHKGYCSIGRVNYATASYVARYVTKKITYHDDESKKKFDDHYEFVTEDGEIITRKPEYNAMSLKPAIGRDWFEKYHCDIFPSDEVIIEGRKRPMPRYYEKLLKEINKDGVQDMKRTRKKNLNFSDCTPERLKAREQCAKNKLNRKKRKME